MENSDSDNQEAPGRSRATLYRRQGSRKRKFHCLESSDSSHDGSPPKRQAVAAEDYASGNDDGTADEYSPKGAVAAQDNAADNTAGTTHENSFEEMEIDESESDSDWSQDLNHIDIEDVNLNEMEDYDPFTEEERDFVIQPDNHDQDSDSSDDDNNQNFNLDHHSLNRILEFSQERTVRESLLLQLALSVRHKLTYECLIQYFQSQNFLYQPEYFPTSKKKLWKILGRNNSGLQCHVYCSDCGSYIGKKKNLGEYAVCVECGASKKTSKASFFVTLSVKKQLEHFLSLPRMAQLLKYRENRVKKSEEAIEDIMDGSEYKKILVDGKPLMNSDNFTFIFGTDGCKIRKGGNTNIYPLYLRLNELPPGLRQKFMFLAGVYVDVKEPNMVTLLHPFVSEMNRLATTGVLWNRNGEEVRSKFVVACFCADGKACAQILNMAPHSSYFGCPSCLYPGILHEGRVRYPSQHPQLPPVENRTDNGMKRDMCRTQERISQDIRDPQIRGHKGITPLMAVKHLDLAKGNASDDLHNVYECAALHHTEIIIKEVPKLNDRMGEKAFLETIDARLQAIKTPSCIARKAGNTKMRNRKQWHGTDWRNWLWYFAPICLRGLIPDSEIQHLERLSHASYLLSLDIIAQENIDEAQVLMDEYLALYDEFGIEKTRLNLHRLRHAPQCVRDWGAYWVYTTFNFESWNHLLMQLVKSPNGALQQIITRHLIHQTLEMVPHMEELPQDFRDQISKILNKRRRVRAREMSEHTYLLGVSNERAPTDEESHILDLEEFECQGNMQVYPKLLISGTQYTSTSYKDAEGKSCDSTIFTFQNTFCTIQTIVAFTNGDNREICGLFVYEHEMVRRARPIFPFAKHICQVQTENNGLLHFIEADQVRAPVVKAPLHGDMFFIPVPNLNEID